MKVESQSNNTEIKNIKQTVSCQNLEHLLMVSIVWCRIMFRAIDK